MTEVEVRCRLRERCADVARAAEDLRMLMKAIRILDRMSAKLRSCRSECNWPDEACKVCEVWDRATDAFADRWDPVLVAADCLWLVVFPEAQDRWFDWKPPGAVSWWLDDPASHVEYERLWSLPSADRQVAVRRAIRSARALVGATRAARPGE